MRRIAREPLLHFLLLGAALFGFYYASRGSGGVEPSREIQLTLDDAQLKALVVEKSVWLQNTVTGDKYMIIYGALGKGPDATPLTPAESGYVTQRFPANQGQFQVRYVDRKMTMQSLTGDAFEASYVGATRTYSIQNSKIVTDLVGTPIEISVYKLGNKYLAARGNEFGYANYEIIPTVEELAPIR